MTSPARLPVPQALRPWLLGVAILTTLPHLPQQAPWLSLLLLILLGYSLWLWRSEGQLPGRSIRLLLVAVGTGATWLEHRTLFGREAGVTLLILFMAMKLLETRRARDVHIVVALGFFLLLTHYFHVQDLPTGLWLLCCVLILTATLIRQQAGDSLPYRSLFRHAAVLLLQSIPIMLALFVLFPRVSGPLWGLPGDADRGRTGLSDEMSPGSISQLVQSGDIAFRVRFEGAMPERHRLYWRGPVLEQLDGGTWRPLRSKDAPPRLEAERPPLRYEMTLEPHQSRWLLALDAPRLPADTPYRLLGTLTLEQTQPVTQRQRYILSASLDYRFNTAESADVLQRNLQLPSSSNPRTRALAKSWQAANPRPEAIIQAALTHFAGQDFAYTLQPPLLTGDTLDQFLFSTRRGFCEHYAAAFVFLMRAAGVPARVVTGYQGGELNPVDNFLIVRQSDAHAWAEVWLNGRGWVRIDPTAVVAPARLDEGIANALPAGEPIPALLQVRADWWRMLRYRWDAVNNAWNQYVLGYSQERQRDFLTRLGLHETDWTHLTAALVAACTALLGALLLWNLRHAPRQDPALRLWRKTLARLSRNGIHCAPAETPHQLLARTRTEHPALAARLAPVVAAYLRVRYEDDPAAMPVLRAAVRDLKRSR